MHRRTNKIEQVLQKCREKDRIAHAYLFTGPEGSQKRETAAFLAKLLNCPGQHPPCETCLTCRKIDNLIHPDVLLIEPSGAAHMIKIDDIHKLRQKNMQTPIEAVYKVFIIIDAHQMNLESANALLKSLEEPQENSVFILTSSRPRLLPSTVISRCQPMRLPPGGKVTAREVISQEELNLTCKDVRSLEVFKLAEELAERSRTKVDALHILEAMSEFCLDTLRKAGTGQILSRASLIQEAKEKVSKNVNLKLLFTVLLMKIKKCAG